MLTIQRHGYEKNLETRMTMTGLIGNCTQNCSRADAKYFQKTLANYHIIINKPFSEYFCFENVFQYQERLGLAGICS